MWILNVTYLIPTLLILVPTATLAKTFATVWATIAVVAIVEVIASPHGSQVLSIAWSFGVRQLDQSLHDVGMDLVALLLNKIRVLLVVENMLSQPGDDDFGG